MDLSRIDTATVTEENSSDRPADPRNRKLYIETVGCQMNVLDSELVVAQLRTRGYELTDRIDEADTILYNTCSVRQHAEDKIYSALGRVRRIKQNRPNVAIGVLGCMAQKDQNMILKRAPHVDVVIGPGQLERVGELLEEAKADGKPKLAVSLPRNAGDKAQIVHSFAEYDPLRDPEMRPTPFQAFLRIMMGCDKFCTYCVVPAVRGPEQSRPPAAIVAEARTLADQGVVEITLLGQTVNSYNYQEPDGRRTNLADLLEKLNDINGLLRIKFITNFPNDMTDDLIAAVRDLPKVSRYLHVPAQSGCDHMLKRMKRMYTVALYDDMLARIRSADPSIAISSDFIVGFCGETEASFQKSVDLVERGRFKNSFIFKYSTRTGTKADLLYIDDVPEEEKKRRNNELLAIQNAIGFELNRELIGKTVEVLVEGVNDRSTGETATSGPKSLRGRTWCDRIVIFEGNDRLIGRLADVTIEDATGVTLFGQAATSVIVPGRV